MSVYENDDEVEEVGIQIPKKRKWHMDSFVAPIDVDFRPKAPTSNENKKALENTHGYIADFFYENSISFNCARSDSYSKMMQAIVQYNDSSTFKPPSYIDLRVKILKKKEETSNWVDNFTVHWETYGVTIMTDWWTDGKGRTLINFLVNCPKGTVFLKSIDGSARIHNAELIYKMLKDVIEEVGEKNVIQICTDNASNYVLAGDWIMAESKIYWMPCAAHCVNLILGDVSKMHLVEETVKDAKQISFFIYNHKHMLHLMRKQTKGR
ncbi:hypothetical protein GIB67_042153 [Kingdonia uniflora]|uniref:DUF659 domain-containing protein n=1 Tax=Kingdonia uniflora TaxID=39325 RepID=A0A7J7NXJ9_9MAGN|nr:hypothetical protein GIB67_042153 [Kingdonia uniflora]